MTFIMIKNTFYFDWKQQDGVTLQTTGQLQQEVTLNEPDSFNGLFLAPKFNANMAYLEIKDYAIK